MSKAYKVFPAEPGEPSKCCRGPLHKEGVYLTIASFYGNRARVDGLASRCKACELHWEQANPESHRERTKRWREKKHGKDIEKAAPGFKGRLKAFERGEGYEGPDADEAAERLRRFERGEAYRK